MRPSASTLVRTLAVIAFLLAGLVRPAAAIVYFVKNTNDSGPGSLRDAIQQANQNDGDDTIYFQLGADKSIQLLSPLPDITDSLDLNAGSPSGPTVELDGTSAGTSAGLRFYGGGTHYVRGLVINRFGGAGIYASGVDELYVTGSYIGTDATGTVDAGNGTAGVQLYQVAAAVIGGPAGVPGNVISGNASTGFGAIDSALTIQGNGIGTNAAGTGALGNGGAGISIEGPAIVVAGNLIGTDATGSNAIANAQSGIAVLADDAVIGGSTAATRNVISGNLAHGLVIGAGVEGRWWSETTSA